MNRTVRNNRTEEQNITVALGRKNEVSVVDDIIGRRLLCFLVELARHRRRYGARTAPRCRWWSRWIVSDRWCSIVRRYRRLRYTWLRRYNLCGQWNRRRSRDDWNGPWQQFVCSSMVKAQPIPQTCHHVVRSTSQRTITLVFEISRYTGSSVSTSRLGTGGFRYYNRRRRKKTTRVRTLWNGSRIVRCRPKTAHVAVTLVS